MAVHIWFAATFSTRTVVMIVILFNTQSRIVKKTVITEYQGDTTDSALIINPKPTRAHMNEQLRGVIIILSQDPVQPLQLFSTTLTVSYTSCSSSVTSL